MERTSTQLDTESVEPSVPAGAPRPRSGWQRVWAELRSHPFGYLVMLAFTVAGPFVTAFLFPEAPLAVGLVGGAALGIYAALCALPGQFV